MSIPRIRTHSAESPRRLTPGLDGPESRPESLKNKLDFAEIFIRFWTKMFLGIVFILVGFLIFSLWTKFTGK